ncbi:MAG: FAD-binding oxidoreductase [Deltaproteobacteria bacterium]|nr:FAD-binding oxidoreductase [Deltaproteobacteria bacterium]
MNCKTYDVVIIGGGIMGSATAYYLMRTAPGLRAAVIEMDPSYSRSSTTLSMANARIQFSFRSNVQISQYAFEVLENFEQEMEIDGNRPSIAYRREGNLFMVNEDGRMSSENSMKMQQDMGCDVEWWTPERIRERFPLYNPEGYVGATFGPKDGHFDAYGVLMGYRAKAISMGAEFVHAEVSEITKTGKRITGVRLKTGESISAGSVVNCAGAWCSGIARTAGVNLPVQPVKRQIFALDTKVKPDGPLPLTYLPSGLYFRTETGGLILLGKSLPEDPVGISFSWEDKRFYELLWPELAEFVPEFESLKLVRGWAGLYAMNTLDENAILGEWPELEGLFLANGFSGHGLQQAPAVGRYIAELITKQAHAMDLSIFGPERILENRPLNENGIY